MIYFTLSLLVLVALFFGYLFYRKRVVINAMDEAVQMVKLGLFGRLHHIYSTELDDREAVLLAAAVTNFIFTEEPTAPSAVQFQAENNDRIEREARRLSQDRHICQLITQAVRTQVTVAQPRLGASAQSAISQLERLRSLGILVAGGEPPSPDTFIPAAVALVQAAKSLQK